MMPRQHTTTYNHRSLSLSLSLAHTLAHQCRRNGQHWRHVKARDLRHTPAVAGATNAAGAGGATTRGTDHNSTASAANASALGTTRINHRGHHQTTAVAAAPLPPLAPHV